MNDAKKSKVLAAALPVFLQYGFGRVNMADLAKAAGISRAALYLLFKNKEDVFVGVFLQWIDETIEEIKDAMSKAVTPEEKIEWAFEIWAARPFELTSASAEARELIECTLGFAQAAQREGYVKFEATIAPVVAALSKRLSTKLDITSERIAHVLASAVRGFKLTAATTAELRLLIKELLTLSFSSSNFQMS